MGAGTPSAEGPLTTPAAQSFSFRTYGPLRVTRSYCAWGSECPPMTPWYVEFSNPLDEAAFDPAQVRIEPELPGAQIQVYGNTLNIQGRSTGRTTYTVRLAGDIGDIYGQSLGSDQVLTFKVGAAQPNLWAPGDVLVTLDPSAKKPAFSVFTINYDRLKVRAYAVQPGDWPAFKSYLRDYYRTDRPPEPPGRPVLSETVRVASRPDEMVETAIDLAPALQDGLGHVVLVVEPVTSLADQGVARLRSSRNGCRRPASGWMRSWTARTWSPGPTRWPTARRCRASSSPWCRATELRLRTRPASRPCPCPTVPPRRC